MVGAREDDSRDAGAPRGLEAVERRCDVVPQYALPGGGDVRVGGEIDDEIHPLDRALDAAEFPHVDDPFGARALHAIQPFHVVPVRQPCAEDASDQPRRAGEQHARAGAVRSPTPGSHG